MAYHRIAEVADLLGMSVSMLRAWTLELAPYLSDDAQWIMPANGHRPSPRYGDGDIVVLCRAQRLREQGMSFEQIRARLAEQEGADDQAAEGHAAPLAGESPSRAKYAYELALDALHDAMRVQGTLIQRLQEETHDLRSAHDHLIESHAAQRSHYLSIIRMLLMREFKRTRRQQIGV